MAAPTFILPAWHVEMTAFVWPVEFLQLLVVDGSGTRPSGTRTLHCGSTPISANTIVPCLGAVTKYEPEHTSVYACMYGASWVSPVLGTAIDGGIAYRPYLAGTSAPDTPPPSFSSPSSSLTVPIGNRGLSIFPYTREPIQYACMRLKAVLRPAPRNWFLDTNEQYAAFRQWLHENWCHYKSAVGLPPHEVLKCDAFPLSVIHIIDDVPAFGEIFVLSNYFDQLGRRPEYHPPMPLLLLPRDVLVAFIDAVPGYTMLYLHAMLKHESLADRSAAYLQAFSRVLQKERLSDVEAYTTFVSAMTDVLRQWASDPEQVPKALPSLPSATIVTTSTATAAGTTARTAVVALQGTSASVPVFPSMSPFLGMPFPMSDTPFPFSSPGFTPCLLPPRDCEGVTTDSRPKKRQAFMELATPADTAVASTPCF